MEKEELFADEEYPLTHDSALDVLECVATDCPDLMKKGKHILTPLIHRKNVQLNVFCTFLSFRPALSDALPSPYFIENVVVSLKPGSTII